MSVSLRWGVTEHPPQRSLLDGAPVDEAAQFKDH
jgi:hypothetical protein